MGDEKITIGTRPTPRHLPMPKTYRLTAPDGATYESSTPGELGGKGDLRA
jgi:hypothetical protein